MNAKQLIRANFRRLVFERDRFRCRKCGSYGGPDEVLDAHHIVNRTELPNGGYIKENGISLCPSCHLKAEKYHQTNGALWWPGFHPDELFELIGSSAELAREKAADLKNYIDK